MFSFLLIEKQTTGNSRPTVFSLAPRLNTATPHSVRLALSIARPSALQYIRRKQLICNCSVGESFMARLGDAMRRVAAAASPSRCKFLSSFQGLHGAWARDPPPSTRGTCPPSPGMRLGVSFTLHPLAALPAYYLIAANVLT